MSVSVFSAAKKIGNLSDWSKTNLELQKILYIAHMIHLGRCDAPLVDDNFEAWYLGPVHPALYHQAKIFGSEPVQDIFKNHPNLDDEESETKTLNSAYDIVGSFTGSRLIAITHCDYGAWQKNYRPGIPNVVIPNDDILAEYRKRVDKQRNTESV